jgi:hypothetical protein
MAPELVGMLRDGAHPVPDTLSKIADMLSADVNALKTELNELSKAA